MRDLTAQRRFYAEEVAAVAAVESDALVEAFARVPRERFLGPGPWRVVSADVMGGGASYRTTRDSDPAHLYHNVAVAIDADKMLNNGQPSALATWINAMAVHAGDRVVHVGCGVGYYTAIIAELAGASGRVTAIDIDPALAARARANLADRPAVDVVHGDAATVPAPVDALLINAGCTYARAEWLDALAPGGRLVIPLTGHVPGLPHGAGLVLKITRSDDGFAVEVVSPVMIFDCRGARDPEDDAAILGFMRGGAQAARRLRRDPHDRGPGCVLHTPRICLGNPKPAAPV